jgi:hypothetical protein
MNVEYHPLVVEIESSSTENPLKMDSLKNRKETEMSSDYRNYDVKPTFEAETPEPPAWLNPEGKHLYRKSLEFRMDCDRYGNDATWRRTLRQQAVRAINPEE